ncbi:MAG: hypothetical protein RLZZ165_1026 [Bacteroidota bacterium]
MQLLYFDIEASEDGKSIQIGAIRNGAELRTNSIRDFLNFKGKDSVLVGHNIWLHDLRILREREAFKDEPSPAFIDTLLLSPLIRPERNEHKLDKDYKQSFPWINDPIMDSRQCEILLRALVVDWEKIPDPLKAIYHSLLKDDERFSHYFQLVDYTGDGEVSVREVFQGMICGNAPLDDLAREYPSELAYVLAILQTEEKNLYTPSWLLKAFPSTAKVFDVLRAIGCGSAHCPYCSYSLDPLRGLANYFNYESFRRFEGDDETPLQEQAVNAALKNESILVIFPTGGGKSLTFQLPALIRGQAKGALTVVISPLQSLMKDQVDGLQVKGIATAVAYNGLLNPLERADVVERIENGQAQILYLAPESLRSRTISKILANRHIDRFVVDEAHCFSSWGQDFRVDYLYIGKFIQKIQALQERIHPIPVSCFTATARLEVIHDIQEYFKHTLGEELTLYQTLQGRVNLEYESIAVADDVSRFETLCGLLEDHPVPTIVYVSRVKATRKLREKLAERGYQVGAYHGKMESEEKKSVQDAFKSNALQIMVATSAFGMGVDKEDVGMVVHYEISPSLENYVQEAGRAGRNPSLRAKCFVLYNEEDLNQHFVLLNALRLTHKEISQIWRAIKQFRERNFSKSAREIARAAGWDTEMRELGTRVSTAINALEQARYIDRQENSPRIFANGILYRNFDEALKVLEQHRGQLSEQDFQNCIRMAKYILSHKEDLQVDKMAERLAISLPEIVSIVHQFRDLQLFGDSQDMKARVDTVASSNNSKTIFQNFVRLERKLLSMLWPEGASRSLRCNLRELNAMLQEEGAQFSTIENIRLVLLHWEIRKWIQKERLEAGTWNYRIQFQKEKEAVSEKMASYHEVSSRVLDDLYALALGKATTELKNPVVEFSVVGLKSRDQSSSLFSEQRKALKVADYERALLDLHFCRAIDLKEGLLVFFNRYRIVKIEENSYKQYTKEDYEVLGRYYDEKIKQVHIVGEYAKRLLQSHQMAMQFVDDYFRLDSAAFIRRYFPGKEKILARSLTERKFHEIFGGLSAEQNNIVRANEDQILVSAGPGSGKTKTLVHKMASLLLLEEVKPEQFLMLAFSRPAAIEFRQRLNRLVPGMGSHIDIFTYHAFAFQLLGRPGDLSRMDDIIGEATVGIREKTVPLEKVAGKTVIMLDEFQDVGEKEYALLQAIVETTTDIRMIAAGDDDQAIYGFRGSKMEYMMQFAAEKNCRQFFLTTNYRSLRNLVEFTNQYLPRLEPGRLKSGQILHASSPQPGSISITTYQNGGFLRDVAAQIQMGSPGDSIAILTRTNEEGLQLKTLLEDRGLKPLLLGGNDGFSLGNLEEVRAFSEFIEAGSEKGLGLIPEDRWKAGREFLSTEFRRSANLALVFQILDLFQAECKEIFRSDWKAFMGEIRLEDVYRSEDLALTISTMHKSKGKEFDEVHLVLDHFYPEDLHGHRLLYVAMTRAKSRLHIYTNHSLFSGMNVPGLILKQNDAAFDAPSRFVYTCGLKDIGLNFFKDERILSLTGHLLSGDSLYVHPGDVGKFCWSQDSNHGFYASKSFKELLVRWMSKGYQVQEAKVGWVVRWRPPDDPKEWRVVLPVVTLGRV